MSSEIRESQSEYKASRPVQTTQGAPFYWSLHNFWKKIDALDNSEFSPQKSYAIALYHALLHYADKYGKCYPSQETLAKHIGCSIKTVKRALDALRFAGLVETDQQEGMKQSYTYFVHRTPDTNDMRIVDTNVRAFPDTNDVRINNNQLSNNNQNNNQQAENEELRLRFDMFWKKYRRTAGTSRQKAWESWQRINPTDELFTEIGWALEAYNNYWEAEETEDRFVPHPVTWLNQERWKDPPTPAMIEQARKKKQGNVVSTNSGARRKFVS